MSEFQEQSKTLSHHQDPALHFAYARGQNCLSQKCYLTPVSYLLPAEPGAPLAWALSLLLTHRRGHGYECKLLPLQPTLSARTKAGNLIHASSRHSSMGFSHLAWQEPKVFGKVRGSCDGERQQDHQRGGGIYLMQRQCRARGPDKISLERWGLVRSRNGHHPFSFSIGRPWTPPPSPLMISTPDLPSQHFPKHQLPVPFPFPCSDVTGPKWYPPPQNLPSVSAMLQSWISPILPSSLKLLLLTRH